MQIFNYHIGFDVIVLVVTIIIIGAIAMFAPDSHGIDIDTDWGDDGSDGSND